MLYATRDLHDAGIGNTFHLLCKVYHIVSRLSNSTSKFPKTIAKPGLNVHFEQNNHHAAGFRAENQPHGGCSAHSFGRSTKNLNNLGV